MRPRGGPRPVILAVDDDADVLEAFQLILADRYELLTTTDATAGLALVTSRKIDLIVLDLLLNRSIDGMAFVEEIRALGRRIPVLVVSTINTVWTAAAAMRLGALDYITKPLDEEAFLAAVESALEFDTAMAARSTLTTRHPRVLLVGCEVGLSAMLSVVLSPDASVRTVAPGMHLVDDVSSIRPDLIVLDAARRHADAATVVERIAPRIAPGRMLLINAAELDRRMRRAAGNVAVLQQPHTAASVLAEIGRQLRHQAQTIPRFSPRALKVIEYVSEHFTNVHIPDLGASLGHSPYYLSRLFRIETGMTLKGFINQVRVEAARLLLCETDEKLEAIAARLGFHDAAHLSRSFVKYSGRRPGEFRKSSRITDVREFATHAALGDLGLERARIREKLRNGQLPRMPPPVPVGRFSFIPTRRAGVSEGTRCAGCDEAIKQGDMICDYTYTSGAVIAFHEECERIWKEERGAKPMT